MVARLYHVRIGEFYTTVGREYEIGNYRLQKRTLKLVENLTTVIYNKINNSRTEVIVYEIIRENC